MCDVSPVTRVTMSLSRWEAWPQLDNYNILISTLRPVCPGCRGRLPSPGRCPPLAAHHPAAPGSVSGPGPGPAASPGLGREERDLMRVRGPDIKFISRVGWANHSAAFPGACCQPGHSDQCGGRIRECLINLIGFVSAHSNLGPSIKWCHAFSHICISF